MYHSTPTPALFDVREHADIMLGWLKVCHKVDPHYFLNLSWTLVNLSTEDEYQANLSKMLYRLSAARATPLDITKRLGENILTGLVHLELLPLICENGWERDFFISIVHLKLLPLVLQKRLAEAYVFILMILLFSFET